MSLYYLGLDCSTQSLTAVIIESESAEIVYQRSLNYSTELSDYGVGDGFLPIKTEGVVHAPPLMWIEALDRLLLHIQADGFAMHQIVAVSGCAQQHGTVYLAKGFNASIQNCDPKLALHQQLQHIFSRDTSPIWMDSSTAKQCAEISDAMGGEENLNQITGSVAVERFSAAQIKKFADNQPEDYAQTETIQLISSFMASLFAGRSLGIDYTDASGMNLLDIHCKEWHQQALSCCADQLQGKLISPINPQIPLGTISQYFVKRYGFSDTCYVLPWCGDNPSSLVGLGLVEPGMTAISLGSSDTCFGLFKQLPEVMSPWAHTFIAPTLDFMSLLCFKNGALARDAIRQTYQLDWQQFSDRLKTTRPGNHGAMMLPWFSNETVPKVHTTGVQRFNLNPSDAAANCRAVIEAQMMAVCNHANAAGLHPTSIRATGGGSENPAILQIMADVFACPVETIATSNSAALGAALRAVFTVENKPWLETVAPFTEVKQNSTIFPDPAAVPVYHSLKKRYAEKEASLLEY